jgi:uncharacterized protein YndB with AHSA1/START domain
MANQAQQFTITRMIRAAPSRVYAVFTRADGWRTWFCDDAVVDATIGGKLYIYAEGYNAYGEFMLLEQNKTLTFTWEGDEDPAVRIHILLNEQDGGTLLTFTVMGLGSEQEWTGIAGFLERTWGRALTGLKAVLEENSEM